MGKKFVIEVERGEKTTGVRKFSNYTLVGGNDRASLYDDEVERAAAAYSAKAAPAPVSTAWEPKRDEVVLVEMEFVREKAGGEVYVQKGDGNFIAVPRSAIVGPAPVRARFAVGDEARRWIPVEERLPCFFERVILFTNANETLTGKLDHISSYGDRYFIVWETPGKAFHITNVTHWMPLPEPPLSEK